MDRTARQKLGISRWIKCGGNGVLNWSTGVGKSYATVLLIRSLHKRNQNLKVLIGVPTEVLKDQWIRICAKEGLFTVCKVEIFNTIVKHFYDVDLFVVDECDTTATPVLINIYNTVRYKYILGLTATWYRLDGKEVLLEPYMQICDTISVKDAVDNNWLSPYRNYKVLINVDLTEYNKYDQKFHQLFSIFDNDFKLAMELIRHPNKAKVWAKRKGLNEKDVRGYLAAWMRMLRKRKEFVMRHPKKFEIADKILDARKDKKCITFCATIKDSEHFKDRGPLLHSKRKKAENKKTIEAFNDGGPSVLSTNKSADAGVDIKGLSVGIILSGDSSSRRFVQRTGRCIRLEEGKLAEMFTLVIANTNDNRWFENANNGQQYITLTENDLDIVLNGGEVNSRPKTAIANLENRF